MGYQRCVLGFLFLWWFLIPLKNRSMENPLNESIYRARKSKRNYREILAEPDDSPILAFERFALQPLPLSACVCLFICVSLRVCQSLSLAFVVKHCDYYYLHWVVALFVIHLFRIEIKKHFYSSTSLHTYVYIDRFYYYLLLDVYT